MKKLLALLLALMMPFCALADAYEAVVSVSTNEAVFVQQAQQILKLALAYSNIDVEKLAGAIAKVMNGLGLRFAFQEDAVLLDVELGGGSVFDLIVHEGQDAIQMTTSLLPGYVLQEKPDDSDTQEQAFAEAWNDLDWQTILGGMIQAVHQGCSALEMNVTKGLFVGDAYEGGTKCTTYMFSDADIAEIFSAMLTDELREAAAKLLMILEVNASDVLAQIDELNKKVADEDIFTYVFRVVENDVGETIGLSLIILQEMQQVATASLGISEQEVRLVLGLGVNELNYWWEIHGAQTIQDDKMSFSGNSREWTSGKEASFAYVREHEEPLSDYAWSCSFAQNEDQYLWDGLVSTWNGRAYETIFTVFGDYVPDSCSFNGALGIGEGASEIIRIKFAFGPTQAIDTIDENAVVCDLTNPADEALAEKLQNQLAASLLARLIKQLPMDLILTIQQLTIPE